MFDGSDKRDGEWCWGFDEGRLHSELCCLARDNTSSNTSDVWCSYFKQVAIQGCMGKPPTRMFYDTSSLHLLGHIWGVSSCMTIHLSPRYTFWLYCIADEWVILKRPKHVGCLWFLFDVLSNHHMVQGWALQLARDWMAMKPLGLGNKWQGRSASLFLISCKRNCIIVT